MPLLALLWIEYVGEAVLSPKGWRRLWPMFWPMLWPMLWPGRDPGKKPTGDTRPLEDDAPGTGGERMLGRLGLGLRENR